MPDLTYKIYKLSFALYMRSYSCPNSVRKWAQGWWYFFTALDLWASLVFDPITDNPTWIKATKENWINWMVAKQLLNPFELNVNQTFDDGIEF